jgi:thioredoxin-related protein
MKKHFLTAVLLSVSILVLGQTQEKPKDLINWISFEEAIAKQKENPKTIMIDMYTDWCGWCTKMDAETFHNPDIANYINTYFYAVKFNAERTDTMIYEGKTYVNLNTGKRSSHQLAQQLLSGRMSYPTIVYIDYENNINPIPGYMDVNSLEPLLIYFTERINKNCEFLDFKQDFINTFMPDSTSKTDGSINWLKFDEAMVLMKEKPKKLILLVNSDFNNGSKLMLGSSFRHPAISEFVNNNFYAVKINYDTKDTLEIKNNIFINEQISPNYPHQLVISLLQPDIRLPSTIFFDKDFSLIFALRGYYPPKVLERYLEFIGQDLHKTGGDWQKFNNEFKSKL